MGLLTALRNIFARFCGRKPEVPKTAERFELPTRITPIRPPAPRKRKPKMIGSWTLEPFAPAAFRMEAGRLGRLVEYTGPDRHGRPTWRML